MRVFLRSVVRSLVCSFNYVIIFGVAALLLPLSHHHTPCIACSRICDIGMNLSMNFIVAKNTVEFRLIDPISVYLNGQNKAAATTTKNPMAFFAVWRPWLFFRPSFIRDSDVRKIGPNFCGLNPLLGQRFTLNHITTEIHIMYPTGAFVS